MNGFEQKQEQKKIERQMIALLDEYYSDESIKQHETRTSFCKADCAGCKKHETLLQIRKLFD